MNTTAYHARKATVHTSDGNLEALVFVANRQSDHYVGRPSSDQSAYYIGSAEGVLGSCRDYFDVARQHLFELGIQDRDIVAINRRLPAS